VVGNGLLAVALLGPQFTYALPQRLKKIVMHLRVSWYAQYPSTALASALFACHNRLVCSRSSCGTR
jgi:hypothetical protein